MNNNEIEDLDTYIDKLEGIVEGLNEEHGDDFYNVLENLATAIDLMKTIRSERDE